MSLDSPVQTPVFGSGRDDYHTYRIPALLVTKKGTLLAFCEGRKKGGSDAGDIDLLLKRSFDGGKTWAKTQVVWDDGDNTCGNPCPVVDTRTGALWLLLTHNLGRDRELHAQGLSFTEIAEQLNAEGFRPLKQADQFHGQIVWRLLRQRSPSPKPLSEKWRGELRKDEWFMADLARKLGIPKKTMYAWLRRGCGFGIGCSPGHGRRGYAGQMRPSFDACGGCAKRRTAGGTHRCPRS